jgi:hypothetical protein
MRKLVPGFVAVIALIALQAPADPTGTAYMLTDHWGGSWSDAEKRPGTTWDDNMCWAAAASNVLDWTGWGHVAGLTDADGIFQYFQDHWNPTGGSPNSGWQWWFDDRQEWEPFFVWLPGGGFYRELNFDDYYESNGSNSQAASAIDGFLRTGWATAVTLYSTAGDSVHVITTWGVSTDPGNTTNPGDYCGVWMTDSDDSKDDPNAPDLLQYYEVHYTGGRWFLQDYYERDTYYLGPVHALAPAPEPTTIALLAAGVAILLLQGGRRAHHRRHAAAKY